MPLNFLANLGRGLGGLKSAFGRGAGAVGKGIAGGFKRLGDFGDEDMAPESPGMFRTPDFNTNAGRGVRGLEDAVAAAENDARADSLLERRNLPIPMPSMPGGLPPLTPAPSLEELRTAPPGPPVLAPRGRMALNVASPTAGPAPSMALKPEPLRDYRGREVRSEIDFARDQSVREGMDEGGGFRRSAGMTLKNALLGASAAMARGGDLGSAIGGAVTAGAGSLINPRAGLEFGFEYGERPKLEAEMAREQAARDRERVERAAALDLALKAAQVNKIPLDAENERAKVQIARDAEERQRLEAQSRIALNQAEILAKQTGQAKLTKLVNPETKQIDEVWVFPDGRKVIQGPSGDAEMERRRDAATMERTKYSESAATGRTAMGEAGEDRRQQKRIDADKEAAEDAGGGSKLSKPSSGSQSGQGGTAATIDRLRKFYNPRGITDDAEIRRRAKKNGVTVKD